MWLDPNPFGPGRGGARSTKTESADKMSSDERKDLPVTTEQTKQASRTASPLSGASDNDGTEKPVREKLKKTSIAGLSAHVKKNKDQVNAENVSAESSAGEEDNSPEDTMLTDTTSPLRGRPARKRSFDDLQNESIISVDTITQNDPTQAEGTHKRMRSRDMTSSKITTMNGRLDKEQVVPLTEEHDVEAQKSPGGAGLMVEAPSMDDHDGAVSGDQSPKKKRSRDQFDRDHDGEGDMFEKEEKPSIPSEKQPSETEDELTRTTTNSDKGEPDKKRHRDASQENKKATDTEQVSTKVWI